MHEAVARDDTVARRPFCTHPEVVAAVCHERVRLHEGACVKKQRQPLACCELPLVVLRPNPCHASAGDARGTQSFDESE